MEKCKCAKNTFQLSGDYQTSSLHYTLIMTENTHIFGTRIFNVGFQYYNTVTGINNSEVVLQP